MSTDKTNKQIMREVRRIRRAMPDDERAQQICDQVESVIAPGLAKLKGGGLLREGPKVARRAALHPLWRKPPPEPGGK